MAVPRRAHWFGKGWLAVPTVRSARQQGPGRKNVQVEEKHHRSGRSDRPVRRRYGSACLRFSLRRRKKISNGATRGSRARSDFLAGCGDWCFSSANFGRSPSGNGAPAELIVGAARSQAHDSSNDQESLRRYRRPVSFQHGDRGDHGVVQRARARQSRTMPI